MEMGNRKLKFECVSLCLSSTKSYESLQRNLENITYSRSGTQPSIKCAEHFKSWSCIFHCSEKAETRDVFMNLLRAVKHSENGVPKEQWPQWAISQQQVKNMKHVQQNAFFALMTTSIWAVHKTLYIPFHSHRIHHRLALQLLQLRTSLFIVVWPCQQEKSIHACNAFVVCSPLIEPQWTPSQQLNPI